MNLNSQQTRTALSAAFLAIMQNDEVKSNASCQN